MEWRRQQYACIERRCAAHRHWMLLKNLISRVDFNFDGDSM